eukprot:scaffold78110_cov58-Phaeocystis_antarctica.AAC.2
MRKREPISPGSAKPAPESRPKTAPLPLVFPSKRSTGDNGRDVNGRLNALPCGRQRDQCTDLYRTGTRAGPALEDEAAVGVLRGQRIAKYAAINVGVGA